MRMNTCDNYESCVCFCLLTGPCLQSNLEFCAQGNKMRILSPSLDGQEANGPCGVSRHWRMRSDGVLVRPPPHARHLCSKMVHVACRLQKRMPFRTGFWKMFTQLSLHCWCIGFPWEELRVFLRPLRGLRPQAGSRPSLYDAFLRIRVQQDKVDVRLQRSTETQIERPRFISTGRKGARGNESDAWKKGPVWGGLAAGLLHLVTLLLKTGHPPASAVILITWGKFERTSEEEEIEGFTLRKGGRVGAGISALGWRKEKSKAGRVSLATGHTATLSTLCLRVDIWPEGGTVTTAS